MTDLNIKNHLKTIVVVLIVILIGFGGWYGYGLTKFRVVKTDPKLSSVSTISPYLRVHFNDTIRSGSVQVSDPDKLISKTNVKDKIVTFEFNELLPKDIELRITIKSIQNTNGESLKNKQLVFKAKDIDFKNLSKEQQQQLITEQDIHDYEVREITFEDFDKLLDYGITSGQLQNIKQSIYDYSNVVDKKFWNMKLEPKTIAIKNRDRNSTDTMGGASFNVILDKKSYKVEAVYDLMYDAVQLNIRNDAGVLVYDTTDVGHDPDVNHSED